MNEKEETQVVREDSVTIPEKDLDAVAGGGWIIIDRATLEPSDPPVGTGDTGGS